MLTGYPRLEYNTGIDVIMSVKDCVAKEVNPFSKFSDPFKIYTIFHCFREIVF